MKVQKPIIIFGVGRSGSSVLHRILSHHSDVAWLSRLCDKYPDDLRFHRLFMDLIDRPVVGPAARMRIIPGEAYPFWEHHCKGFSRPFRDLVPSDVTEKTRKVLTRVSGELVTGKRHRLLIKITGWPRVGFMREIFPDARFIHILRDGRAVLNSMLSVSWWWGWQGPSNWRWGPLTQEQDAEWARFGRSFPVLAAIQWKILMDAAEAAKQYIDQVSLLELRYEDLCRKPDAIVPEILSFCELDGSARFGTSVRRHHLESRNDKWKTELSPEQQRMINESLEPHLARYGYQI